MTGEPDGIGSQPAEAAGSSASAPLRSPRVDKLHQLPPTERRVAMRRLASAGREVIELMSSSSATADDLDSAAESLEAVAAMLRGHTGGADYEGVAEMANAGDLLAERRRMVEEGDPEAWAQFDYSPFIGLANPMSPPMHMDYEGDRVVCHVTFGSAFEGPPACVHGGYVAAAFDEVLGAAQSLSGEQGMTARLVTNYRSPTPLHQPLRIEAWVDRREGRKIFVQGTMHAGERLTAEAEGLFIAFDPDKFVKLMEARAEMQARSRQA
ncbi:MAG TPA: PaaI family thioesterase [Microthrixaceae bacterium]|nr:PaaI family thioesterase [Microthrixaceae bacterium]